MTIQHNSEETRRKLKPLVPYSYDAALPTSCNVDVGPLKHLTLLVNSNKFDSKVSVETLSLRPDAPSANQNGGDGESTDSPVAHRVLLAETALVFVLRGSLEIEVQDQPRRRLGAGDTLVAEQADAESPINMKFSSTNAVAKSATSDGDYERHHEVTFVIFEITKRTDPSVGWRSRKSSVLKLITFSQALFFAELPSRAA